MAQKKKSSALPKPLRDQDGVTAVKQAFIRELEWHFREQQTSDYGIDAQVEIAKDGVPTGKLIALQIKSGTSYFKKRGADFVYYGKERHLEYWTTHSLPVFLILHNPETDVILWQKIEKRLVKNHKKGRWSITVPASNVLNKASAPYLKVGISSDPEAKRRFAFSVDAALMRKFDTKKQIFFEIGIWVNKGLGFRGIFVYFDQIDRGNSSFKIDWWGPFHDVGQILQRFMPWLEYEYLEPPEDISGEIEVYKLQVWLSPAAKHYLAAEKYFATGKSKWRPPEAPVIEKDEEDDTDYWRDMYEDDD